MWSCRYTQFARRVCTSGGAAVCLGLALLGGCGQPRESALPALAARLDQTSVSGLSSGAYMAGQFELAHASIIVGAGIIAGGPYGCAESFYADAMPGPGTAFLNLSKAINGCMLDALRSFGIPDAKQLAARAAQLADKGRIDPLAATRRHRVYLFSGQQDRTVVPAIVAAARDLYLAIGVADSNVKFVQDLPAGHAFVTQDRGASCERTDPPYIVDCDYDQAGDLLRQIYGDLSPKAADPAGQLLYFDQREFVQGLTNHSMSDVGAAYIPSTCQKSSDCRVHVAFHGCAQNRATVGDAFIKDTGYLQWAETNRLVVLFPQAERTTANPQGCWDWWGYTGPDFLTKDGPQIVAVRRMLERLAGPRSLI